MFSHQHVSNPGSNKDPSTSCESIHQCQGTTDLKNQPKMKICLGRGGLLSVALARRRVPEEKCQCFGMIGNSTNHTEGEWRERERREKERIKSVILSTWRSCDLTLLYAFSQRTLEGEQGGGPSPNNLQKQSYQFILN